MDTKDGHFAAEEFRRQGHRMIDWIADYLNGEGLNRAILVSDPFHLARLRIEARRLGLEAWTSPTATSPISRRFGTELQYLLAEAGKLPILVLQGFFR